jgi:glycosyltransferase involved in cell wall biosynthesis
VIATKASPLPSILGDGGLYIDPTKPEELENTLVRVLKSQDLRKQMRAAGLVAAHSLTWEKEAQEMIKVIQSVVII